MTPFNNIDIQKLEHLKKEYGFPLHVIFKDRFVSNAREFRVAADRLYPNTEILFAVKSNPCRGAIKLAGKTGIGVDTVSQHELKAAIKEGISGEKIICNGNAKTDTYLTYAITHGACIALDNAREMQQLDQLAMKYNRAVNVLIRVVDMPLTGLTSLDQSTAAEWTKFGFSFKKIGGVLDELKSCKQLQFKGYSAHIGTQICDAAGFDVLLKHFFDLSASTNDKGLKVDILDLGGGYPINYMPEEDWRDFDRRLRLQLSDRLENSEYVTWNGTPMGYEHLKGYAPTENDKWSGKQYWTPYPGAKMLERILTGGDDVAEKPLDRLKQLGNPKLFIEPGRGLIGSSGITIAEVMSVKDVLGNNVVIIDMGINNQGTNLITPDIFPCRVVPEKDSDQQAEAFLAGRLCFSGDMISKVKVKLNRLPQPGEMMIIHHTGSYCADHFASHSCGFPRPGKVALDENGNAEIWRKPEVFEDVFADLG